MRLKFPHRKSFKDNAPTVTELYDLVDDLMYDYAADQVTKATAGHAAYLKRVMDARRETDQLRAYLRRFRSYVELAARVLVRGRQQKKKAPTRRIALATLEAALSDPEPGFMGVPSHLLTAIAVGGMALLGLCYKMPSFGYLAYQTKTDGRPAARS